MIVVVVDDDSAVRGAIGRFLRCVGHQVHVFESAEAYLAQPCEADCAILDVQLPGLNAFELEAQMRREGCDTPVVFISAHDEPVGRTAEQRARAPLLRKPIDEDGLLRAITTATTARP